MSPAAARRRDRRRPPGGPRILILAGPNGAGKTTFALNYLPREAGCLRFVNADLIAAGLSPLDVDAAAIRAGRLMLEEIRRLVARGESFSFETTLAGRRYARLIPEWRRRGYRVHLAFLSLPDADLAVARVAARVRQGGHDVPEVVVRRRFAAGRANFERIYRVLVDSWVMYDSSQDPPAQISSGGLE